MQQSATIFKSKFLSPSSFSLGHKRLEELNHYSSQDKIHHLYRMGLVLLQDTMLTPFFSWNYSQIDELSHPTKSFQFFLICFLNRDCNSSRDQWPKKKAPEINNRLSVSLDAPCGVIVFLLFTEQPRGSWLQRCFLQASVSWTGVLLSHWSCFSWVPGYYSKHFIKSSQKASFCQNPAGWLIFLSKKIERAHNWAFTDPRCQLFYIRPQYWHYLLSRADKCYCIPFQYVMLLKIV